MKNICIQNWFGRLGNNILQVKNALHLAFFFQYNVIIPKHKFFNSTYISINKDISIHFPKITDIHNFYYNEKIPNVSAEVFNNNLDKVIKILKTIFIYPPEITLPSNSLVIHIRSGDIFSSSPHPNYINPPLSYYTNIINSNTFSNIYLIAEDKVNPCIESLLELYPNITFTLQSLEKDIQYILAANSIIISYGTMINSLLLLSSNIQYIYMPSYNFPLYLNSDSIHIHLIKLDEYKELLSPWKNSNDQRFIMLTYSNQN